MSVLAALSLNSLFLKLIYYWQWLRVMTITDLYVCFRHFILNKMGILKFIVFKLLRYDNNSVLCIFSQKINGYKNERKHYY